MKKSTLTLISIICFICMSISKAESKPSQKQIKKFIEAFEDQFKLEHSTDADYIENVYQANSDKKVNKILEKFSDLEITRVGRGNKSFKTVEYFGQTAMHPDVWETVFYFVDGKLFCIFQYKLMIDFNSAPSRYWTKLTADKYYFENDICTKHTKYVYAGRDIGKIASTDISGKVKIYRSPYDDKPELMTIEAYKLLNSDI